MSIFDKIRDEIRHLFNSCDEEDHPHHGKVAVTSVKDGDTLIGITEKALTRNGVPGDGRRWVELKALNPALRQPHAEMHIQPGDVLVLPADWVCKP